MVLHCIRIAYAQIHMHILVPEPDTAQVMVQYVRVNIQNVIAPPIMFGAVVHVYVTVVSNIVVAVADIVQEVARFVGVNIRVVTVLLFILGQAVLAYIHIVILAQADIKHQVQA